MKTPDLCVRIDKALRTLDMHELDPAGAFATELNEVEDVLAEARRAVDHHEKLMRYRQRVRSGAQMVLTGGCTGEEFALAALPDGDLPSLLEGRGPGQAKAPAVGLAISTARKAVESAEFAGSPAAAVLARIIEQLQGNTKGSYNA